MLFRKRERRRALQVPAGPREGGPALAPVNPGQRRSGSIDPALIAVVAGRADMQIGDFRTLEQFDGADIEFIDRRHRAAAIDDAIVGTIAMRPVPSIMTTTKLRTSPMVSTEAREAGVRSRAIAIVKAAMPEVSIG